MAASITHNHHHNRPASDIRAAGAWVAVASLIGLSSAACGSQSELEDLTIAGVERFVEEQGITRVDELMSALPASMRENYVLMEASLSRHQAEVRSPRIIMFGFDARFMMAVSSLESVPAFDTVEFAELDAETGDWTFRELDMASSSPSLSADDDDCRRCHGERPRPLWANYDEWEGAFGGRTIDELNDLLTLEQAQFLIEIDRDPSTLAGSRLRHLSFGRVPYIHQGDTSSFFELPRRYNDVVALANTMFQRDLGLALSFGIFQQARRSPRWEEYRDDIMMTERCAGVDGFDASPAVVAFNERLSRDGASNVWQALGVNEDAFQPHALPGKPAPDREWISGGPDLHELVRVLVLHDMATVPGDLAVLLEPFRERLESEVHYGWEISGERRKEIDTQGQGYAFLGEQTEFAIDALLCGHYLLDRVE